MTGYVEKDAADGQPTWSIPFGIAAITVVNLMRLAVIGWGGIAANWSIYMLAHGGPPRHEIFEPRSGPASWRGYMPFTYPWIYFAMTGLVFLLVVVVSSFWPALRFTPMRKGRDMWHTTPGFLAALGAFRGKHGMGHRTLFPAELHHRPLPAWTRSSGSRDRGGANLLPPETRFGAAAPK